MKSANIVVKRPTLVRGIIRVLGCIVCLLTLLPLSRSRSGLIRAMDFPRVQVAGLGGAVLLVALLGHRFLRRGETTLSRLVTMAVVAQLLHIFRYTPLAPKQVIRKVSSTATPGATLSLFVANIYMHNSRVGELFELLRLRDPDLVLLLEPDDWWAEQLAPIKQRYPYVINHPQGNTYGMLLYSKLQLIEPEVRFLVQHDVPSIRTQIRLPDGERLLFYGVHPRPPGRLNRQNEIRSSGPRDAELVLVAKELQNSTGPVIVTGDFNDVAWSHTTRRFQRLAHLLDPRIGRGLYNTFHARYPLLRFPVDHLFHSEHFALVQFQRERYIGSDHFPIYAALSLQPEAIEQQEPPSTTRTDHEEAQKTLASQDKTSS